MNQNEPIKQNSKDAPPPNPPREERREWREPTFDRMTLKEAMTSSFTFPTYNYDGTIYYS